MEVLRVENRVILLINSIFVYRYEINSLKQKNIKLDSVDVQIVRQLRKNARLSNKALAAAVGLAQSSCLERVRRLRMARVLTGYHAEVEPDALGIGLQALVAIRSEERRVGKERGSRTS